MMSAVMYAFRASSNADLDTQIGAAESIAASNLVDPMGEGIEFQVFQTSAGIIYRVLENGYGLRNKMWANPAVFPTCNYDDRTDIPEGDEKNEGILDEIDTMISAERYMIVPIVSPTK